MQCACTLLYCHLWPAPLYNIFTLYFINGKIFGKKVIEHKMLIFPTTFPKNFSFEEEMNEMLSYMCITLQVKCLLFFSGFNPA